MAQTASMSMAIPTEMKNRPIKQPLERREIDFDLGAVFGLGQQKPGEKSAECGREACDTGRGCDPHHHEQRDRHDEIAAAGLRREAEDRLQHVTAGGEDGDDREHRLQQGPGEGRRDVLLAARKDLHAEQDRRNHEVLEQEHRERDTTDRRRRAPLLLEQLHHDRGRGHREAEAKHDRAAAGARPAPARPAPMASADSANLETADAGDIAAQRPQPRQRQFKPDHEQEEQHAELGEGFDPVTVLNGQIANARESPRRAGRSPADRRLCRHTGSPAPRRCARGETAEPQARQPRERPARLSTRPVVQSGPLSRRVRDGFGAAN